MTSTHIIREMPWEKEKAILEMEGSHCPCCKEKEIRIVKEDNGSLYCNHYYCMTCGTEWRGNTYDSWNSDYVKEVSPMEYIVPIICVMSFFLFLIFFPLGAGLIVGGLLPFSIIYTLKKGDYKLLAGVIIMVLMIIIRILL